eukprot:CAMPEP_0170631702 /NCGR_PEP_ID=MMETSP0224-20130122/34815_1 /TAXON_ID=285029 /ORGANISM="Togula jolla, Strain CCCM 725" /LENGTH=107 /DNA_ID=CAMNT_0010960125 /DNA_START=438 /DNA_END=759 /DNA_ORIENTATION=+
MPCAFCTPAGRVLAQVGSTCWKRISTVAAFMGTYGAPRKRLNFGSTNGSPIQFIATRKEAAPTNARFAFLSEAETSRPKRLTFFALALWMHSETHSETQGGPQGGPQ